MTLDQLQPGQKACVLNIRGSGHVRRRLMDMGIVRGVEIKAVRCAPLGDPVNYSLLGYHLALRKCEAAGIEISVLGG
jgi:ferrous iron transport protein A